VPSATMLASKKATDLARKLLSQCHSTLGCPIGGIKNGKLVAGKTYEVGAD